MERKEGNTYFLPSNISQHTKYIIVTGGVCSSLGKGVTISTIGALLKSHGYRVCAIKIDPYINVDAGLMSPFEHGEVFVLADGGEVDLDLGNYERWMSLSLTKDHNITTGKLYQKIIAKERNSEYLGKTVTLVPYFTNEVIEHIQRVASICVDGTGMPPQICLIELGGTIGDFESTTFVEALRTLRFQLSADNVCLIHCTYLPEMGGSQKTKPTQHSCRNLLSLGLTADFLVCRSNYPIETSTRNKLSQLCGIKYENIIDAHNAKCLYEIPISFAEQDLVEKIENALHLNKPNDFSTTFPNVNTWKKFVNTLENPTKCIKIAFIGKYVHLGNDAYFSVLQTFDHCCLRLGIAIEFIWIESDILDNTNTEQSSYQKAKEAIVSCDGVFVPGGFGTRGVSGKIKAIQLARENNIPFFGVCLGMQAALIDLARNVLGLPNANSEEIDMNTPDKVIITQASECDRDNVRGMMRIGALPCHIIGHSSILSTIYGGADVVLERHRHRYEFNLKYLEAMQEKGVLFSAASSAAISDGTRIEAVELPANRFFLAVQYHPEFISTPTDPSPPYLAFVVACAKLQYEWPKTLNSRAINIV